MKTDIIGIDIGSVSISIVLLDGQKQVVYKYYSFHKGQIVEELSKALQAIDSANVKAVGFTSSTPNILKQGTSTDARVCFITAAKHFHPNLDALLIVGAEKFGLASFDEYGNYHKYHSNTSCAAGTGNFLDQQVERLNLKSIAEFSEMAYSNKGELPLIASRCAVFAKTDLIHVQQEGYSLPEICDGLSYGLAKNIVDTVELNIIGSKVVAAGGVALNKAVMEHISRLSGNIIIVDEYAQCYGAIGAALNCTDDENALSEEISDMKDIVLKEKKEKKYFYPPLKLELSEYPSFDSLSSYEFKSRLHPELKAVEVDIYIIPEKTKHTDVYLGIDVGSTSTKAVLLDKSKNVIAGLYTRTSGQPILQCKVIFEAVRDIETNYGIHFKIEGAGTTGSGRKFTGKIIGADIVTDEISAHARAALSWIPKPIPSLRSEDRIPSSP